MILYAATINTQPPPSLLPHSDSLVEVNFPLKWSSCVWILNASSLNTTAPCLRSAIKMFYFPLWSTWLNFILLGVINSIYWTGPKWLCISNVQLLSWNYFQCCFRVKTAGYLDNFWPNTNWTRCWFSSTFGQRKNGNHFSQQTCFKYKQHLKALLLTSKEIHKI